MVHLYSFTFVLFTLFQIFGCQGLGPQLDGGTNDGSDAAGPAKAGTSITPSVDGAAFSQANKRSFSEEVELVLAAMARPAYEKVLDEAGFSLDLDEGDYRAYRDNRAYGGRKVESGQDD